MKGCRYLRICNYNVTDFVDKKTIQEPNLRQL